MGNHDYVDPTTPFFRFMDDHGADGLPRYRFVHQPEHFPQFFNDDVLMLPHTRDPVNDWKHLGGDFAGAKLILMHQTVDSAVASTGVKMHGLSLDYFRERVRATGAKIISGDIHVPQVCGPVVYCGSPYPVHFGDSFSPRVLLYETGKPLVSLPRVTLRKVSLVISDESEFEDQVEKGDHVKVLFKLPRSDFYTFAERREAIRAQAEQLGVTLFGVELAEAATRRRRLAEQDARAESSESMVDTVDRYCARQWSKQDLPSALVAAAHEVVKEVGAGRPQQHFNAGPVDFLYLAIQGFRSFTKDQVLAFPQRVGFYQLTGRNLMAPEMGPNGTGKSTVWDALCWVLFGKTSRGTRGNHLVNWGGNHLCSVFVEFRKSGVIYRLTRTQDPNSLSLQVEETAPKVTTQEEVEQLTGLVYETFLHSTLMGQFNQLFFDVTGGERLRLFADALLLQAWVDASTLATSKTKRLEEELASCERQLSADRAKLASAKDALVALKERELREMAGQRARKAEIAQSIQTLETSLQLCRARLEESQKLKPAAEREEARLRRRVMEVRAELDVLLIEKTRLERAQAMKEGQLDQLKKSAVSVLGGTCATCGRAFAPGRVNESRENIEKEVAQLSADIEHQEQLVESSKKTVLGKRASLAQVERRLEDQLTVVRELQQAIRQAQYDEPTTLASIEDLKKSLEDIDRLSRFFEELVLEHEQEIERLEASAFDSSQAVRSAAERRDAMAYWSKGFKELRLWLVTEGQRELEVECGNALTALGLHGWRLRFETERETTSKTVSKDFHVFIQSPTSPEMVPWEVWCGGETQRLRIAGAIGLGNLLSNRRGVRTNIEVWDEPTAHLSEEGIHDLLDFFLSRSRAEQRQIWLVDHRSLNFGGFDGECVVTRDEVGSKIEMSSRDDGE